MNQQMMVHEWNMPPHLHIRKTYLSQIKQSLYAIKYLVKLKSLYTKI